VTEVRIPARPPASRRGVNPAPTFERDAVPLWWVECAGRWGYRSGMKRRRGLHDSISQELFSLSVLAGGLRRALPPGSGVLTEVETMERTAGDTMREMQTLLLALRPVALDEAGLASALEEICRAYRERLGVAVRAELESLVLPAALEHAILRVAQEALANAVKHAGVAVVRLRLWGERDEVVLEVADNGCGFDTSGPDAHRAGLGLRSMRDRVAEHSGRLAIDSTPGAGTVVWACFPRRLT